MTTLEAQPDWKRMDIQKQINEMLIDIDQWMQQTADDRPGYTSRMTSERARLIRIENALKYARDCK
ncbi:hypothetical protein SDC9_119980 [bioreactor metagenome]|jgi:hypothetical protein|uniref:Uncharacterized protein n=1 Tax=bioreactor metagenome TaxID=1076179 RepID=A0A645C9L4_9ZZZZ